MTTPCTHMLLLRILFISLLSLVPLCAAPATIADFAAKAAKREPLSVVFFGGSLTFGANASDPGTTSYRGLMMQWLRARYPHTPIDFHDAAIGGSGSQLGMFRLERDVLRHQPDLVFLDFTVNDGSEDTDIQPLASYERIIRTLREADIVVMPVIMLFKWHADQPDVTPPRNRAHLKLAEAYGLPAADVCAYIQGKVKGGMKSTDVWNVGDGAHPGDEGYQLFFEAVRNRFEKAIGEKTEAALPPSTVFGDLYPHQTRRILVDALPSGWKRRHTWRTALWYDGLASRWMGDVATASAKEKSGPLEIDFNGSMVGVFGERNGLTPPVRVWIDGQPVSAPKGSKGEDDFTWKLDTSRFAPPKKGSGNLFMWLVLAKDLPDGKHTLRIEPIWNGADADAELRIESVCSAGR